MERDRRLTGSLRGQSVCYSFLYTVLKSLEQRTEF